MKFLILLLMLFQSTDPLPSVPNNPYCGPHVADNPPPYTINCDPDECINITCVEQKEADYRMAVAIAKIQACDDYNNALQNFYDGIENTAEALASCLQNAQTEEEKDQCEADYDEAIAGAFAYLNASVMAINASFNSKVQAAADALIAALQECCEPCGTNISLADTKLHLLYTKATE